MSRSPSETAGAGSAQLFAVLYDQLRREAQRALRRGGAQVTITPTVLLHEAFLSLRDRDPTQFPDESRFVAYAARAMRGLVIDHVRSRRAQKRGAGFELTALPTELPLPEGEELVLARLSESLDALAARDPALAELVDLKFFCGFTFAEIAALRQSSERTVQRDWAKARLYLYSELEPLPR